MASKANLYKNIAPLTSRRNPLTIFDLEKVDKPKQIDTEKAEENRLLPSRSQALLIDIPLSTAPSKKVDEGHTEEDDEKNKQKTVKKRHNSTEKLSVFFENLDKIVVKANLDIKRAPLFSHHIWTQNLFDIEKVAKVEKPKHSETEKGEELKLVASRSQGVLIESQFAGITVKKPEEGYAEDEDDKNKLKTVKKKHNSIEKLSNYFESLDKMVVQKKTDSQIKGKVDEMAKELKTMASTGLIKYQETYNDLFTGRVELPPLTSKRNQEFLYKIHEMQRDLRPDLHRNPLSFENPIIKTGNKAKPAKVSLEPLTLSSSRAKIAHIKDIDSKKKTRTNRETVKIPFTVLFT
jgi:hypothetical protein